jgi:tRNA G18 (ribose-2'-O)-methylase SpoU
MLPSKLCILRRIPTSLLHRVNGIRHHSAKSKTEFIYGFNVINEALENSKRRPLKLFVKQEYGFSKHQAEDSLIGVASKLAKDRGVVVVPTAKSVLDKHSMDRPHQGMVLQCTTIEPERILHLDCLEDGEFEIQVGPREKLKRQASRRELPLFVALDQIVDPQVSLC